MTEREQGGNAQVHKVLNLQYILCHTSSHAHHASVKDAGYKSKWPPVCITGQRKKERLRSRSLAASIKNRSPVLKGRALQVLVTKSVSLQSRNSQPRSQHSWPSSLSDRPPPRCLLPSCLLLHHKHLPALQHALPEKRDFVHHTGWELGNREAIEA
eukprot:1159130-Pelagomonas_calceolata.AAC.1